LVRGNDGSPDQGFIGTAFNDAVDRRGGNLGEGLTGHENKREQNEDSLKHNGFGFRLQRNGKFLGKYRQISSFRLEK